MDRISHASGTHSVRIPEEKVELYSREILVDPVRESGALFEVLRLPEPKRNKCLGAKDKHRLSLPFYAA